MSDVTPEAERLAREMWPNHHPLSPNLLERAQRAIAAGWTPPPDPHQDIADLLREAVWGSALEDDPAAWAGASPGRLYALVARIPDDLAAQVADALRGDDSEYRRGWKDAMQQEHPPQRADQ